MKKEGIFHAFFNLISSMKKQLGDMELIDLEKRTEPMYIYIYKFIYVNLYIYIYIIYLSFQHAHSYPPCAWNKGSLRKGLVSMFGWQLPSGYVPEFL